MFQLGSTVFDPSAHMLRDSTGAKIALRAQSARVLECLIEAQGALLSKEQLFKAVWADVSVTDDSLVQCIREIRNAIGDAQHVVLQTEARRGYRLVRNGHGDAAMDGPASMPAALSPSTPNADGQITPAIAVMAYDLCARITAMGLNCTVQGMRDAQLLAARAVALSPHYARAWHAAAAVHLFDINQCLTGDWTDAHIPQALQEAHKAIELDSSHAMAYGGLATLLLLNGQHKEAMLSSRRAMDLGPGDPMILNVHAFILFHTGRFEQSKKIAASMIGVSPLRLPLYLANYAKALLVLGEHHEAIELLQEALVTTPGFNAARAALIVALEETGLHRDAMKHYELLMAHSNGFNHSFSGRRWDAIPEVLSRYVTAFQAQGMQAEK